MKKKSPRTLPGLHLGALLLGLALLAGCEQAPRFEPLPQGATVLALGDSITHGTGAPPGADYPGRLAHTSGWQVINAGVPGDTSAAARDRLAALLAQHQPDLAIVELGGNDFLRRHNESVTREALGEIIARLREGGMPVVLVAVPRLSLLRASTGTLADHPLYEDLAANSDDILLVPDLLSEILSQDHLRADEIHPNAAGYRALAEGLAEALRAAGLLAP